MHASKAPPIRTRLTRARPPRRLGRIVALWLALAAIAALAWFWQPLVERAATGAAYGARIGCSCRHVANRPLSECRADFEPGMGAVMLSEDGEARTVTATVPLLARQTARWQPGAGCVLEGWKR